MQWAIGAKRRVNLVVQIMEILARNPHRVGSGHGGNCGREIVAINGRDHQLSGHGHAHNAGFVFAGKVTHWAPPPNHLPVDPFVTPAKGQSHQ